jgi:DTW domain-containing protein YfiP
MENSVIETENQREICYSCYRPKTSCVCEHIITPIKTNTKFIILMHPKEYRKTKNGTGHMTNNSLENCELYVGIDFTNHKRVNELLDDKTYEPYILYPDVDSIKLNTQTPIIILSAYSQKEMLLEAIDLGISKYFIKPFDIESFIEYLKELSNKINKEKDYTLKGVLFFLVIL